MPSAPRAGRGDPGSVPSENGSSVPGSVLPCSASGAGLLILAAVTVCLVVHHLAVVYTAFVVDLPEDDTALPRRADAVATRRTQHLFPCQQTALYHRVAVEHLVRLLYHHRADPAPQVQFLARAVQVHKKSPYYALQLPKFQSLPSVMVAVPSEFKRFPSLLLLLKIHYFQRKHKEKPNFPLIIEYFLLYLQRNTNKTIHQL